MRARPPMASTSAASGCLAVLCLAALALSGCGSTKHSSAPTTTTASSATSTASATTSPSSGPAPTSPPTSPSATPGSTSPSSANAGTPTTLPAAVDENVTTAVRASLLAAGAAHQGLPTSDYTGLQPGVTYYAYMPAANTYWAGAALAPSPSSQPAQVSGQDDGAYLLFEMVGSHSWQVWDVGLAGTEGSTCPANPPAAVVALWGWSPGSCRPANI